MFGCDVGDRKKKERKVGLLTEQFKPLAINLLFFTMK